MSSTATTGQATSSTSNIQLFIDALADYAQITGIDLARNPFAASLGQSTSPEAILQLLHDREKAFKEYRDGDRRLITCLSPAVKILHAFSGIMCEAASLIPFSPANVLFAGIDALLAAASGVSSSYDALLDLFECLGNFLKRLEIYTTIPPTPIMTDIIVKIMIQLLSVLALATKQIKQGRFKKFAKKLLGDSEVEAVVQRLDRLTQEEARMAATQTLGVVHGLVDNMKIVMEDGKASTDGIRQDLVALHQVVHEMNKIKSDQLRCESCSVQYWLSPPDPSTNHKFLRKALHDGTATWFFESNALTEWRTRGSFLWIHGKPGAGKSTLLSAIIHDVEGMHEAGLATMAYYYFDFRDVKKQDCHGLLSSLISQLSAESDSCFRILSKLYSDHGRGSRQPDIDALKKCITDMLSLPGQAPVYIIVDAIDECPNFPGRPSAREEVLELIKNLVNLKLPSVHLCVASRPEMDIRVVLEPLTFLKISLHDESGQKEDIIEYIRSVVHSDWRMQRWKEEDKQFVIDTLSDRADGMFRWVVCQVDRLRRTFPASIRTVLNDLPKTLDETYDRILQGIDEEKREYAQRLLRCLTVSIRPLRLEELAEIFAVQFYNSAQPIFNAAWRPEDAEEAVLSACSSLITIVDRGGHQIVQFSHYSVKEYLTSERLETAKERLSYYHILLEPAHTTLAHACLIVLLQLDDKIDRNTIDNFPLASYAARHWVEHARYGSVSSRVEEVMERLFDRTKPHFSAWVWLYDVDRRWVDPMSGIHPMEPEGSPLYYAALCGFRGLVGHLLDSHLRNKNVIGGSHTTRLRTVLSGFRGFVGRIVSHSSDTNSRGGSHTPARLHSAQSGFRVRGLAKHRTAHSGDVNIRGGSFTTPLHAASLNGHLDVASLLLVNGADPNSRDNLGRTPLHRAPQGGQFAMVKSPLEIARLLVNSGANVKLADDFEMTPLHDAALSGNRDVAELLLDSGASLEAQNWEQATPLHHATINGMLNIARFLIDRGSDVNLRQNNGTIPLHVASQCGHIDIARILLDCRCDVNARDTQRWTPLHYASQYGQLGVAQLLIDRGADVNAHAADRSTPIHFSSASGSLDIAKLLVEQGANVDSRNDEESTPLGRAANAGYIDIAQFLIESGAAVSSRDNRGWTPFHAASYFGHVQIAKLFIECGVDVDIRNQDEESSLHLASRNGKLDATDFLIEHGADIHAKDHTGSNALHTASQNGHLDVVRMLIDIGIAVDIRNETRRTPLALASSKGEMEVGRFLIERGADVSVRDDEGWAPLHFASRHGHLEMARLLLDHGADANIQRDDLCSPLHLASAFDHLKIAELLIQRGANVDAFNEKEETPLYQAAGDGKFAIARLLIDNGANVHSADSNGRTVLHAASQGGHLGVVKLLLVRGADVDVLDKANKTAAKLASANGKAKIAKFIAKYKADPNIRKKLCSTPLDAAEYGADEDGKKKRKISLHAAAEEGMIDVVKSLLERGADINGRNASSRTPLHEAAFKGNVDVMHLLIERGAEVDSRNKWGWTSLHYASRYGHLEASRVLVNHGADVNARMNQHWTPLHLSIVDGHLEIVKLLLEHGADIFARNEEDQTPYQESLIKGHRRIADLLREHGACK